MNEEVISPETSLLVVTDGITETSTPDGGELFGMEGLAKVMAETKAKTAQELVESVTGAIRDYRQTLAQHDDVTVLALVNRKTGTGTNP